MAAFTPISASDTTLNASSAADARVLAARRPGFDLTFSASKSVSVLFAIGDVRLRAVVQEAHDRAGRDALGYLRAKSPSRGADRPACTRSLATGS